MYETLLTFTSQKEYQQIREDIQVDIQRVLGVHESFLVEVAINEAVNNALHSNKHGKPITLHIRVTPGNRLIIRVKDQGNGFDAAKALEKISESKNFLFEEKLMDESGRGLAIMKNVTDKVIFNRKGNEILLMKYLDRKLQKAEVCE